jgi:uncharacterized protein (DUF1697 family)
VNRYVALLRGVNVGGKGKVSMAELRALFESMAFRDVTTYIQSGNVVFSAPRPPAIAKIEAGISDRFGLEARMVIRSAEDLSMVIEANPFPKVAHDKLHVGFLAQAPAAEAVAALDAASLRPEEFVLAHSEIYLHLPAGMGRAKLPAFLDRRLRVPVTYRNWATVSKLYAMASEPISSGG